MIASKTRIAPIKTVNIVRLELCGAVLNKRLGVFIESEMSYEFTYTIHIIDSEIVKSMIDKQSHGFKTFAANRIGDIQGSTRPDEWYWMSGGLNIADYSTRGKHPTELNEGSSWQKGPSILQLPMDQWPIKQHSTREDLPERTNLVYTVQDAEGDRLSNRFDLGRFSKLSILSNTTARILKLYRRYKNSDDTSYKDSQIAAEDIRKAERFWMKEAERDLQNPLEKGELVRLTPRYNDGLIVVGGRTKRWTAATWNYEEFVLLPYSHRLSYLIA